VNCPHCQKDLPVNYNGGYCPYCGKDLPPPLNVARPLDTNQKISWPWFFVILFLPVVLTMLTARLPAQAGGLAALISLCGGPVSGIICGAMLARRLGRTEGTKIVFGIVLIPTMVVVCVALNFFGCLVSSQGSGFH
jgi:hypothetical protein